MIQPVPQHGDHQTVGIANVHTRAQIRTRNGFDAASLGELAASIARHGVLQPIVVTPRADGGFDLIAGERRVLAASMAGLTELPAVVRSGTVADLAAAQAVENLQREDLHPADVAEGLEALKSVHGSWRDVARSISKSPAWVSKRRGMARLRPITKALMIEGHTDDIELLLTLSQIERTDPTKAGALADGYIAGKQTRETIRHVLAAMKQPARNEAADDDEDTDDDGEGETPATTKAATGLTMKLSALDAGWLRHHLREDVPVSERQKAMLAKLDAWWESITAK